MDYQNLTDLIDELGRLGTIGREKFEDYLRDTGRDGDPFVIEGMAFIADAAENLEMRA